MTIISVTANDTPRLFTHDVKPGAFQARTQIPRATARFAGTKAIATLAGGNQTVIKVTLDFPANRQYLLKQAAFMYQADTVEATSFEAVGSAEFVLADLAGLAFPQMEMVSSGISARGTALKSLRVWQPTVNYVRPFINGSEGDTLAFTFFDPDAAAGGKVAGDFFWSVDFWVYDIEQVRHYEINTPAPVICF